MYANALTRLIHINHRTHQLHFVALDDISVLPLILFHDLPRPLHLKVIGQIEDYMQTEMNNEHLLLSDEHRFKSQQVPAIYMDHNCK